MKSRIRAFRSEDTDAVNRIVVAAYEQYRNEFANWAQTAAYFAESANLANELELLIAEGVESGVLGAVRYVAPNRPRDSMFEPGMGGHSKAGCRSRVSRSRCRPPSH